MCNLLIFSFRHVLEMEQSIASIGYSTTDDDINRLASQQLENSQVNLDRNSCQKYTPSDCFFGDFSHWDPVLHPITFCKFKLEKAGWF